MIELSRFTLSGVALAICAIPTMASAQIWIGEMVGQMANQQAAAQREQACIAGTPAPPEAVTKATAKSAELMAAYFDLSSRSKPKELGRVFDLKREGVAWKSSDGAVQVTDLGAILDGPMQVLEPMSFVVAGDGTTARGIWAARSEGDGKPQFYAVDFSTKVTGLLKLDWRIWHMSVLSEDSPPAAPGAYCHYDPDQAW